MTRGHPGGLDDGLTAPWFVNMEDQRARGLRLGQRRLWLRVSLPGCLCQGLGWHQSP